MLGLLLDGHGVELLVELHHAEALGVVHVVAEHGCAALALGALDGGAQVAPQAVAVEDVVAQHQRAAVAVDELLADDEGLRQSVGRGLLGVGQAHAIVRAVLEQALEVRQVGGRRDDEDLADARHHEHRQRVVDHRLVVHRKQLLRRHRGERVQPGATASSKYDALHRRSSESATGGKINLNCIPLDYMFNQTKRYR